VETTALESFDKLVSSEKSPCTASHACGTQGSAEPWAGIRLGEMGASQAAFPLPGPCCPEGTATAAPPIYLK